MAATTRTDGSLNREIEPENMISFANLRHRTVLADDLFGQLGLLNWLLPDGQRERAFIVEGRPSLSTRGTALPSGRWEP